VEEPVAAPTQSPAPETPVAEEPPAPEPPVEEKVPEVKPEVVAASTPVTESKSEVEQKVEAPKVEEPKVEEQVTEPETPPSKGAEVLYEQGFDDEDTSAPPKDWVGDYDYAKLTVSDETPAPDSKKCLRFEKKAGAGSAYYYCRFPDVKGMVQIEFDLRCDEKNKYLLGVYIEKDGDFRQSIHTIIHRTEAQTTPSLRIHGEPVPYTFGSWVHIRYVIDLEDGSLDGFVDDNQVSSRVYLASNPRRLNTISVRDNLATTGVLKIDNIRVTKL
jgi:hypothetical protein